MPDLNEIVHRASRVAAELGPRVTEVDFASIAAQAILVSGTDNDALNGLGITLHGRTDCSIVVTKGDARIGNVTLHNVGEGNTFLFANSYPTRECNLSLRVKGSRCQLLFCDMRQFPINIGTAYLRSDDQLLYWGSGATSVMSRMELEGAGRRIAIGDDSMLSSGVWIRNHDMHTIFDLESLEKLNSVKADIVIEQHVWLGFDALILSAPRIGFGSIIGARSLLKREVPPECIAAGLPAKVIRSGVGWCRSEYEIQPGTLRRLERLRSYPVGG